MKMNDMDVHREQFSPTGKLRYEIDTDTGCWIWQMNTCYGYAYSNVLGGRAHRWYYRMFRGPLTSKQLLHHECENTKCVNPWHLVPMSAKEHAKIHLVGKKMQLSGAEHKRRREHGKKMIKHARAAAYSKTTRQEAYKKGLGSKTPEEMAEIGRKISKSLRAGIEAKKMKGA